MSTYLMGARPFKGALVAVDPLTTRASVIVFQYNPATLQRSLQPQYSGGDEGERVQFPRFSGAPVQSIHAEIEIDATDQLAVGDPTAVSLGITPQLAALEMLVYPSSLTVVANSVLAAIGTIEIVPTLAPLTLFIWGPRRVVPVRIASFSIAEEAFDQQLNPIRATVSVDLRVLTYSDLELTNPGYALFLAHQLTLETLAAIGSASTLSSFVGINASAGSLASGAAPT